MHILSAAALSLPLLFAALPGTAGCPTGGDMATGIVLAQNTPFFMRSDFKATDQGFAESRVIEIDGKQQNSMELYRHGLVMTGEHSGAGHTEINYVDRLDSIYDLPTKGKVAVSGIAKGPAGEAYVKLELTFLGKGTRKVGDCSYDTWQVRSKLTDRDGAGSTFRLEYAPSLDLVLAADLVGEDGSLTPAFAYQWAGTPDEMKK